MQATPPQPEPGPEAEQGSGKRLKDIPRGKEAVTYPPFNVEQAIADIAKAAGELPTLEDESVSRR